MSFSAKREKYCSIEEMNKVLDMIRDDRVIKYGPKDGEFRMNAWIEDGMVQFKVTTRDNSLIPCTYIFYKDARDRIQQTNGLRAYQTLIKNLDGFKIDDRFKDVPISASPFLWYNKEEEGKRQWAIAYDINSSYSWAMKQPMPDTTRPSFFRIVDDGEIGFNDDGERIPPGKFALYVFPLIESPFIKFVDKWYERKRKAKDALEKEKAKEYLNFSVGYLQKKNPFLRAQIVGLANERIQSFIDENTLMCNTDSIISKVRREDIENIVGTELGDFKIEHIGMIAYKKNNYQWTKASATITKFRGVPQSWFDENWDILRDPTPKDGNIYRFDKENIKLVKVKYGEER